jgi:hypothetical protein
MMVVEVHKREGQSMADKAGGQAADTSCFAAAVKVTCVRLTDTMTKS